MEYGLYILTGVIFKGYDDIIDGKEKITPFSLELLKVLITTLLTISCMKSPMFALFFCAVSIFCLINQSADTDFWKAGALIPFVTILFHIPYFLSLSFFDYVIRFTALLGIILFLIGEHIGFPEDMSRQKYYFRIVLNLCFVICIYLSNLYNYSFLIPLWLFGLGYFGTNLVYHFPTFLSYFSQEPNKSETAISQT